MMKRSKNRSQLRRALAARRRIDARPRVPIANRSPLCHHAVMIKTMLIVAIAAQPAPIDPDRWPLIAARAQAQAEYFRCTDAAKSWFQAARMSDYSHELCQPHRTRFEAATRASIDDDNAAERFIDQTLNASKN